MRQVLAPGPGLLYMSTPQPLVMHTTGPQWSALAESRAMIPFPLVNVSDPSLLVYKMGAIIIPCSEAGACWDVVRIK